MILTIDIGNTSIAIGGFLADELKFVVRLSTDITKTEDEYASKIRSILSIHEATPETITGAIISSVVPPLNPIIKKGNIQSKIKMFILKHNMKFLIYILGKTWFKGKI